MTILLVEKAAVRLHKDHRRSIGRPTQERATWDLEVKYPSIKRKVQARPHLSISKRAVSVSRFG